jgi:glycosyltransferase involved in cell wall biosynthesis
MKLIVQIPCYHEEHTLPGTVADIPREIEGIDQVEILVIDDGSTDNTAQVARSLGVEHVVVNKRNQGLGRSFRIGIDECLRQGADLIVNTDGDNQYAGWDIPKLVKPVRQGLADIVIGDRQTHSIEHFSYAKKFMQWLGSGIVRRLAGLRVPDTVSGFRAISREAAIRLNVLSSYSYTTEMVIQAGKRDMTVMSVPVETNAKTRESRLYKSVPGFIIKQVTTIIRVYAMYQPLKTFFYMGSLFSLIGLIPIVRFLYFYLSGDGGGHLQSLVLGGVLVMMGFLSLLAGLVADLISSNRQLLEIGLEKIKRMELDK